MELKVIGKRLITPELDGKITEGEYRADVIGITVPKMYGGLDLSRFSFRITAVSSENGILSEQVLASEDTGDGNIRLVWTVTADFTAESGEITLILAGVDAENKTQLKFTSSPFRINPDDRNDFLPSPTVIEQAYNQIQLEVQKAVDAAVRAENAAKEGSGVKSGGDITVDDEGIVTVISVKGKTVGCDVPENAVFTDTVYTLPAAGADTLGGVRSGGDISVSASGGVTVNSVKGKTVGCDVPENAVFTDTVYTLPKASERVLGGVILDGTTITADENGIISSIGGTGGYVLPKATDIRLGGVRVDGTTITADEMGVISVVEGLSGGDDNVIESIKVNGVMQTVNADKSVDITIPDTYATKTYVGEQIANAEHLSRSIVTALPADAEASENVIYMLKADNASGEDKYKEYMKIDGTLQLIGDTSVDLSGYAKAADIPAALPANGGNADTVGGHTVNADVPENAVFTDTVYTLPAATADTLGGVKVDGTTITSDENGVISAAGGNGGGIIPGDILIEVDASPNAIDNTATYNVKGNLFDYDFLFINAVGRHSSLVDRAYLLSGLIPTTLLNPSYKHLKIVQYNNTELFTALISFDGEATVSEISNMYYFSIRGIKL